MTIAQKREFDESKIREGYQALGKLQTPTMKRSSVKVMGVTRFAAE